MSDWEYWILYNALYVHNAASWTHASGSWVQIIIKIMEHMQMTWVKMIESLVSIYQYYVTIGTTITLFASVLPRFHYGLETWLQRLQSYGIRLLIKGITGIEIVDLEYNLEFSWECPWCVLRTYLCPGHGKMSRAIFLYCSARI